MTYKPGELRKHSKMLILTRNWAICTISALLGLGLFVSEIQRIRALVPDLMNYLYLGLVATTGVLIFAWIWSTQKELDLLFEWLDPERYAPPSSLLETMLILFIGIVLTALVYAARDPFAYATIFCLYSIVMVPTCFYMNREIKQAIDKSKIRLQEDTLVPNLAERAKLFTQGVNVLEAYFLGRPMILRLLLILMASGLGWALAFCWRVRNNRPCGLLSYVIFLATILFSESVIGRWRCIRDRQLRGIESELSELLRKE